MRDLHARGVPVVEPVTVNGHEPMTDDEPAPEPSRLSARLARRDRGLAAMVVLMIDTAKMLEPIVDLLSHRALRWATLATSTWLAFYALQHPSWERLAVVGAFMLCSIPIWWKA